MYKTNFQIGVDTGNVNPAYNNYSMPLSHTQFVTNVTNGNNFMVKTREGGPLGWLYSTEVNPPPPFVFNLPPGTRT